MLKCISKITKVRHGPNCLEEVLLDSSICFSSGDLIEFYNQEFLKKFKTKILEFKNKKYNTLNQEKILPFQNDVSPFLNKRIEIPSTIEREHRHDSQQPNRMLNFDEKFEDYEISAKNFSSKPEKNLESKMEFAKMIKTKSPEQHMLQKFKTDVCKYVSSPNKQILSSEPKSIEALKYENRPKIYQAQKNKLPESNLKLHHKQLSQDHIKRPCSKDEESDKKYQSQYPPAPVKFQSETSPQSNFLEKTFQILHKPLTSTDTSVFSYFTKKKLSENKVSISRAKQISSNMTRMARTGPSFRDRGFLKQSNNIYQPNEKIQSSNHIYSKAAGNPKKTSNRFMKNKISGNISSKVAPKNLYSKARMSKYRGVNFSSQNRSSTQGIEQQSNSGHFSGNDDHNPKNKSKKIKSSNRNNKKIVKSNKKQKTQGSSNCDYLSKELKTSQMFPYKQEGQGRMSERNDSKMKAAVLGKSPNLQKYSINKVYKKI